MKKYLAILSLLLAFSARAQFTITNVNIGTDSNSIAWGKVNANNANFVAWMNALAATNNYLFNLYTNTAPNPSFLNLSNQVNAVGGITYPSNAWNLMTITSALPNFAVWVGNSNGCCLVTLSVSNGVVRYLQSLH